MQTRRKGAAFLIGNGWSVDAAKLDGLTRSVTFSMNNIAGIFDRTPWRPTYYVMVTTRYKTDPEFRERAERAVCEAKMSFVDSAYRDVPFFAERAGVVFIHTHERLEWSVDYLSVSKYATSMLATIQIAANMGYDPLYLYGVDGYRAREAGPNHFAGGEYNTYEIDVDVENEHMRAAYELVHRERPGLVVDCTDSPGYGVFPKMTLW